MRHIYDSISIYQQSRKEAIDIARCICGVTSAIDFPTRSGKPSYLHWLDDCSSSGVMNRLVVDLDAGTLSASEFRPDLGNLCRLCTDFVSRGRCQSFLEWVLLLATRDLDYVHFVNTDLTDFAKPLIRNILQSHKSKGGDFPDILVKVLVRVTFCFTLAPDHPWSTIAREIQSAHSRLSDIASRIGTHLFVLLSAFQYDKLSRSGTHTPASRVWIPPLSGFIESMISTVAVRRLKLNLTRNFALHTKTISRDQSVSSLDMLLTVTSSLQENASLNVLKNLCIACVEFRNPTELFIARYAWCGCLFFTPELEQTATQSIHMICASAILSLLTRAETSAFMSGVVEYIAVQTRECNAVTVERIKAVFCHEFSSNLQPSEQEKVLTQLHALNGGVRKFFNSLVIQPPTDTAASATSTTTHEKSDDALVKLVNLLKRKNKI